MWESLSLKNCFKQKICGLYNWTQRPELYHESILLKGCHVLLLFFSSFSLFFFFSRCSEIAQVIAPYTATGAEQLTLAPGQLILIRKKNPGGWWEGELQVWKMHERHAIKYAHTFYHNNTDLKHLICIICSHRSNTYLVLCDVTFAYLCSDLLNLIYDVRACGIWYGHTSEKELFLIN